jgi:stearoyl-CoA desaturase (delta-9 desaturase)
MAPTENENLNTKPGLEPRPQRRFFAKDENINWFKSVSFFGVHLVGFMAPLTGISWAAVGMCLLMYFTRMFAITGGYHRYFSHRTYKTSRFFQFLLAFVGASSGQKGPLWWAAYHRHHHKYSDTEQDIHSPVLRGFWWAHIGWILCDKYESTHEESVKDLTIYPELRWINKYPGIAPIILASALFFWGAFLKQAAPGLHTNGVQMLAWGFFTSTIFVYHGTFFINSLMHVIGKKRFETGDYSKNSLILALTSMGEGWHNNHHRYPYSERQGIYWWEIDMTHYILRVFSWMGVVWDIKTHPPEIYLEARGLKGGPGS